MDMFKKYFETALAMGEKFVDRNPGFCQTKRLQKLEKQYGVSRAYWFLGVFATVALSLYLIGGMALIVNVVGFSYPVWASFKRHFPQRKCHKVHEDGRLFARHDHRDAGANSPGSTAGRRKSRKARRSAKKERAGGMDRAMLEEVLSSHISPFREELRESINSLNVDIRRQFHSLREEKMAFMSNSEERLGVLQEGNKTVRGEIARLRRAY